MSKPLMEAVFERLQQAKEVRTQTEFADSLEVTKGYMSQLLKQGGEIPTTLRGKLNKRYGVSILWMASNGEQGNMFDTVKNTPQSGDTNQIASEEKFNEKFIPSQLTNYEIDMNRIIKMMADRAEAQRLFAEGYKIDAEARLLDAQVLDRLTASLASGSSPKSKAS